MYGDTIAPLRGRNNEVAITISLNPGEAIISVTTAWDQYLCSVTFTTNLRSFGPYAAYWWNCNPTQTATTTMSRLLYLLGASGWWTDSIYFAYSP